VAIVNYEKLDIPYRDDSASIITMYPGYWKLSMTAEKQPIDTGIETVI